MIDEPNVTTKPLVINPFQIFIKETGTAKEIFNAKADLSYK